MSLFFDLLALIITGLIGVYGGLHLSLLLGKEGVEKIVSTIGGTPKASATRATRAVARRGKSKPVAKVEEAGVAKEGYHIYNVCTYDKDGQKSTSTWRRFSEFCTLDAALEKQLEVSTSRNYNIYTSQIEGMLPSKTIRKLDAGLVEVRRLGLSEYMGRLYSIPEVRELATFQSFIANSSAAERHQLQKRLSSLMTPMDVQEGQGPKSPSPVKTKSGRFSGLQLENQVSFSDFRQSVDSFSKSGVKCSTAQRLTLYGLYKQSMFGDVDYERPKDDPKGQRKYDAWNAFNGLSQSQSMSAYVGIVDKLLNTDGDHASKPEVFAQSSFNSGGVYKIREEVAPFESEEPKELFDEMVRRYYDWESFGAAEILKRLKSVLAQPTCDETKKEVVQKLMAETDNAKLIKTITEKGQMAENALSDFTDEDPERWIFSQESFGTKVWYRQEEEDGSLWVKVEAELNDSPVADVLSVWKEINLFPKWFPTCHNADILWESEELKGAELVASMKIGMMPLVRDAVIVGYGDLSTKSILILGKSITEWPGVEIPEPQGWTTKRMSFRALQIMVEPISPTSTKCCLISNMDLNAVVPQSLLNLIMRKVAGLIMIFLEKEARRIQEDPDNSEHAKRIATSPFYTEQLAGKMDRFLSTLPKEGEADDDAKAECTTSTL